MRIREFPYSLTTCGLLHQPAPVARGLDGMEKRRRHITEIVTEETIAKEIDFVLSHLAGAERMLMPAVTEEERRRRQEIIGEAAKRMFVAGLLCLKAYEPRQYSALATAAMRYLRERIEQGTAAFTAHKPRGPKAFGEWMHGTRILAAYEEIVRQLEDAWKKLPTGLVRPLPPRAPRTARYSEVQHVGGQRYHQRLADRISAVQRAAETVLQISIGDDVAKKWLKNHETPSRVALAMLGDVLKRSPRGMRDLLNRARKQVQFAKDNDRVAFARGLRPASSTPAGASAPVNEKQRT